MGLNLNDELVDIGNDLINYGRLHIRLLPHQISTNPQLELDENEIAPPQKHFAIQPKGDLIVGEPQRTLKKEDQSGKVNNLYFIVSIVGLLAISFVIFYC